MFWAGLGKPVQKTASFIEHVKTLSWNASVWDPNQTESPSFWVSLVSGWRPLTSPPPRASDYAAREI